MRRRSQRPPWGRYGECTRGNDPRNLITMTSGSNHPHMFGAEDVVLQHVKAGGSADVNVRVEYHSDDPLDYTIHYKATDIATGETLVDTQIKNGLRKGHKCCG